MIEVIMDGILFTFDSELAFHLWELKQVKNDSLYFRVDKYNDLDDKKDRANEDDFLEFEIDLDSILEEEYIVEPEPKTKSYSERPICPYCQSGPTLEEDLCPVCESKLFHV